MSLKTKKTRTAAQADSTLAETVLIAWGDCLSHLREAEEAAGRFARAAAAFARGAADRPLFRTAGGPTRAELLDAATRAAAALAEEANLLGASFPDLRGKKAEGE